MQEIGWTYLISKGKNIEFSHDNFQNLIDKINIQNKQIVNLKRYTWVKIIVGLFGLTFLKANCIVSMVGKLATTEPMQGKTPSMWGMPGWVWIASTPKYSVILLTTITFEHLQCRP